MEKEGQRREEKWSRRRDRRRKREEEGGKKDGGGPGRTGSRGDFADIVAKCGMCNNFLRQSLL